MPSDLQTVLDELAAMRGLVEILSPLPSSTRSRILAWLTSVVELEATPTATIPTLSPPDRSTPGQAPLNAAGQPASRLAERIAQLNRGDVPEVPEVAEADHDKPRASGWRGK